MAKGDHRTVTLDDDADLWPSHQSPGCLYASLRVGPGVAIPVPPWFLASWHAGAPVNGLLDYLLENDLAPPALRAAIEAAYATPPR